MLSQSFIFLPSVGPTTERSFWQQGISSWHDFLTTSSIKRISPAKKYVFDKHLKQATQALHDYDSSYFSQLPLQHSWRLYEEFKEEAVFLDIETADFYGDITVIGLYDGKDTKMLVRGFNLNKELLECELKKYKLIITFNGASFDLPVIRRYFGNVIPNIPHIDLRGVCSKIGLVGGLKSIEKQLGIERPDDLQFVFGDDACWLWHKFKETQEMKYLDILIRYNEEDIVNLKPIAEHAVKELWKKIYPADLIISSAIPS
jgi:hypothetical protein